MKVLIITKSFIREVSYWVRYAQTAFPSWQFSVVMPHCHEELPAILSTPPLYFSNRIRTAFYAPTFLSQFRTFQPDIIHIFEEFSGLMAFQCTLFRDLFCQRSKVMVYSAENIQQNVRSLLWISMKYVMKQADLAFVCSHSVKDVLEQEGFSHPIEVFPLGVDTTKFYNFPVDGLRRELQLDGKFVLGYAGRLLRMKGIFMLIDAMNHLQERVHLLIVGSGPEEQNLRKAAMGVGVEQRVHVVGNIPYHQLPDYMNCMDVGIVPSQTTKRWKEQFGRVLVEMMSCELPVIGTNSGSIPEVLGDLGNIIEEANLQQLLSLIRALIESPKKRRIQGKQGRARVLSLYSTQIMGERFGAMYHNVMRQ